LKKGISSQKKSARNFKLISTKLKINLDDKLTAFTFALPIKKGAFFKGKKNKKV
jgi:hypothetical protein